jgi:hypothetical protein
MNTQHSNGVNNRKDWSLYLLGQDGERLPLEIRSLQCQGALNALYEIELTLHPTSGSLFQVRELPMSPITIFRTRLDTEETGFLDLFPRLVRRCL